MGAYKNAAIEEQEQESKDRKLGMPSSPPRVINISNKPQTQLETFKDNVTIREMFSSEDMKQNGQGHWILNCPHCGAQGGRSPGFTLFEATNYAHCQSSTKNFRMLEAYALKKGIISCLDGRDSKENDKEVLNEEALEQTLEEFKAEFGQERYEVLAKQIHYNKPKEFIKEDEVSKLITEIFDKPILAGKVWNIQPYFYDNTKMWWLWDASKFKWCMVDDTDILLLVKNSSSANCVASKDRNEILEAMKQYGREHIPKPILNTWIQFKGKVYMMEQKKIMNANPKYFFTSPIPYTSTKGDTPTFDRIFEQWVGKEHIETLYEIIAYSMLPDYPIHRIFCLLGAGLNGKSCFQRVIYKTIGRDNIVSTDLDVLCNNRFEVSKLYKKLACFIGETDFSNLTKSSVLKRLSGGDLNRFEFKGKNGFDDYNYAKLIISTNNLPATDDKTVGFYRRWMIIDFPNEFNESIDILSTIPEQEYENLCYRSMETLIRLLEARKFTNEGSIEDRKNRYEAKSNFLEKFIETMVDRYSDGHITKAEFLRVYNDWCKENGHRQTTDIKLGMDLKKLQFEEDRVYEQWMFDGKGGQVRCWMNIKWKN